MNALYGGIGTSRLDTERVHSPRGGGSVLPAIGRDED